MPVSEHDEYIDLTRNDEDYPWRWTARLYEVDPDGQPREQDAADGDTPNEALTYLREDNPRARKPLPILGRP